MLTHRVLPSLGERVSERWYSQINMHSQNDPHLMNKPVWARDCNTHLTFLNPFNNPWNRYYSKVKLLVAQSCLTLCDPLDCSPRGSTEREILQARILGWVAIPFSGDLKSSACEQTRMCLPPAPGMSGTAACPLPHGWWSFSSTISHPLSLLQAVTLLAC